MAKQLKISQLGKTQLKRLREDIVLNSLNIRDYQNRYNIDPKIVCNFFDSYIEHLFELAKEDNKTFYWDSDLFNTYDNIENLYNYYSMLEW